MFVGMSPLGNGYLFVIPKSKQFTEVKVVDSKDAKFNELFIDMRGPTNAIYERGSVLPPELKHECATTDD